MGNVKSFIKEVVARLQGDNAEVLGQKIYRKAMAAVASQKAALAAQRVDQETRVEEAEEAYKAAKYPTEVPIDNGQYIRRILTAKESLDAAKEYLEQIDQSLKSYSELEQEFESEA